jgi:hypothetical protein
MQRNNTAAESDHGHQNSVFARYSDDEVREVAMRNRPSFGGVEARRE